LSFAGEAGAASGVGEGSGAGISTTREVREDLTPADAPIPKAKVFSDKPTTHAKALVRTATFLKCFGIIPSSGILLNFRHTLARNA
jgi:hypothetical protein